MRTFLAKSLIYRKPLFRVIEAENRVGGAVIQEEIAASGALAAADLGAVVVAGGFVAGYRWRLRHLTRKQLALQAYALLTTSAARGAVRDLEQHASTRATPQ